MLNYTPTEQELLDAFHCGDAYGVIPPEVAFSPIRCQAFIIKMLLPAHYALELL